MIVVTGATAHGLSAFHESARNAYLRADNEDHTETLQALVKGRSLEKLEEAVKKFMGTNGRSGGVKG